MGQNEKKAGNHIGMMVPVHGTLLTTNTWDEYFTSMNSIHPSAILGQYRTFQAEKSIVQEIRFRKKMELASSVTQVHLLLDP